MNMVLLEELMAERIPSLDPAKYPNETFELLSIPAFDVGEAEYQLGQDIGSAKKMVQPNDVLLARIVPHIRRSWVVPSITDKRQIASGEWIVFRSERFYPPYLRHVLISDPFHNQFMQTVAGVGGSLLRARPEGVKKIKIPLPPLEEQKRIAGILDQADALRRLRARALEKLNTLGQAVFQEMFSTSHSYPTAALSTLVRSDDKINYGVVQPGNDVIEGVPLLRAGDVTNNPLDPQMFRRVSVEIDAKHKKSRLKGDEILVACVGSIGAIGLAHEGLRHINIARAVARIPIDPQKASRNFIASQLKSARIQNYFKSEIRLVAQPTLNIKQISECEVIVPPLDEQIRFENIIYAIAPLISESEKSLFQAHSLFASLQSAAFQGKL